MSRSTLEWSIEKLINKNDRVRLVSVIDSKSTATYSTPGGVPIELETPEPDKEQLASRNAMLNEYAQRVKKKVGENGVKASTVVSRSLGTSSDHGREICEFAAEMEADILVLGSRGYGSFKRSIMVGIDLDRRAPRPTHSLASRFARSPIGHVWARERQQLRTEPRTRAQRHGPPRHWALTIRPAGCRSHMQSALAVQPL